MDTEKLKDTYHYRLNQALEHGPQAAYLHKGVEKDYARQIMAEVKELDEKGVEHWVNPHNRANHLLDCEVICHAAADPEFPGGGIHLIRGPGNSPPPPVPPAARQGRAGGNTTPNYQRPGWLNR